ncbi:MAG: hypothetical protein INH43_27020 [Acidobacteriaceae bacterium]|jgi:hypothetical protein|nr:hypothetical protein [Acidobacteriaceae bacterium]
MYSYAWEQFVNALNLTVADTGTLPSRLANAWLNGLYLLRENDLAPEEWQRLESIRERLSTVTGQPSIGTVHASAALMSEAEASDHLKALLEIFIGLCRSK